MIGRIGNGVQISDRTAAVKRSDGQISLANAEKGPMAMMLSQKTCL